MPHPAQEAFLPDREKRDVPILNLHESQVMVTL